MDPLSLVNVSRREVLQFGVASAAAAADFARSLPLGAAVVPPAMPTKAGFAAPTEIRGTLAFAPPNFNPQLNQPINLTTAKKGLTQSYNEGFRAVVFYASDLGQEQLVPLARQVGFPRVFAGIFAYNLTTYKTEVANVMKIASQTDGIAFVNEPLNRRAADGVWLGDGVGGGRFTIDWLRTEAAKIRAATNKPIAVTESMNNWRRYPKELVEMSDACFANCHPFFSTSDPTTGAKIALDDWNWLASQVPATKPLILRECWWPSAGAAGATQANQSIFFQKLSATPIRFLFGASHERPWMNSSAVEPYFGLHQNDSAWTPKKVIADLKTVYTSKY